MNTEFLQHVELLVCNGERDEAQAAVDQASEEDPEAPVAMVAEAILRHHASDHDTALQLAATAEAAARDAGDAAIASWAARIGAAALRLTNRHDEALEAAGRAMEAAAEAGDKVAEANALTSKAQALGMLNRYEDALQPAERAIEAAGQAGDKGAEAHALTSKAQALGMLNRYEDALQPAERAIEAAGQAGDKGAEAHALHRKAAVLRMLLRYDEALEAAEGAAEAAVQAGGKLAEANALGSKAQALRMLHRHDEALEAAERAAEAAMHAEAGGKLAEANALDSKARALRALGRDEEALEAAEGAAKAAVQAGVKLAEANALDSKAEALRVLGRGEQAIGAARAAVEAAQGGDHYTHARALRRLGLILSDLGRADERDAVVDQLRSIDADMARVLQHHPVRPGWMSKVQQMHKRRVEREADLRTLLREPPVDPKLPSEPDPALGELRILRKWASYTTLGMLREKPVAEPGVVDQVAGGYLVWWRGWGLVIDPGLGFGRAFRTAGFVPRNIDAVLATHHHIDHTGDMLPILTCLFEMGQEDTEHNVDFYLSPGAFGAFADLVAYVPGVGSVQLLRAGETVGVARDTETGAEQVATIRPVKADHRDLTGRTDSAIGVVMDLVHDSGACRLGFTGDTRYHKGSGEAFRDVDLLVAHVGSVYARDVGDAPPVPRSEQEEGYHLGIAGTIGLLTESRDASGEGWDPLVLLSEWGEELGEDRTEICEVVQEATGITRVWPAELNAGIGLRPRGAGPLCGICEDRYATEWRTDGEGNISYECDLHGHGTQSSGGP